jgi:hypothetical protein
MAVVYFDRQHAEGVAKLQSSASARPAPAFNAGPIVATIFGIPAVVIVAAALNDASLPIVGSGRGALIGLWILVSVMCGQGIASMMGRFGGVRPFLVGAPLGILAVALSLSALFGWTLLLQPIANAMGPSVSLDRAAIVGVGAIMLVKWSIAWTSYLPRSS